MPERVTEEAAPLVKGSAPRNLVLRHLTRRERGQAPALYVIRRAQPPQPRPVSPVTRPADTGDGGRDLAGDLVQPHPYPGKGNREAACLYLAADLGR
jgi:hypothetical protein